MCFKSEGNQKMSIQNKRTKASTAKLMASSLPVSATLAKTRRSKDSPPLLWRAWHQDPLNRSFAMTGNGEFKDSTTNRLGSVKAGLKLKRLDRRLRRWCWPGYWYTTRRVGSLAAEWKASTAWRNCSSSLMGGGVSWSPNLMTVANLGSCIRTFLIKAG